MLKSGSFSGNLSICGFFLIDPDEWLEGASRGSSWANAVCALWRNHSVKARFIFVLGHCLPIFTPGSEFNPKGKFIQQCYSCYFRLCIFVHHWKSLVVRNKFWPPLTCIDTHLFTMCEVHFHNVLKVLCFNALILYLIIQHFF